MHGRSRQTWKLTGTNLSTKLEAVSAKWWTLAVSARSMTLGAWPSVDSQALHTTCDIQERLHTKFAVDSALTVFGLTDHQFGLTDYQFAVDSALIVFGLMDYLFGP